MTVTWKVGRLVAILAVFGILLAGNALLFGGVYTLGNLDLSQLALAIR